MNCGLSVDRALIWVPAAGGQGPYVELHGFASACGEVVVSLKEGTNDARESSAIPVEDGRWTARFPSIRAYTCPSVADDLIVAVRCANRPECDPVELKPPNDDFAVRCRTAPCPAEKPDWTYTPRACAPVGGRLLRRVDLTAAFTPSLPAGASGVFKSADGAVSGPIDQVVAGESGEFRSELLPMHFSAGAQTVVLQLNDYPGCEYAFQFPVEACACEARLSLEVRASDGSVVMRVDADGNVSGVDGSSPAPDCVPAGDYELVAQVADAPGPASFRWYVDGSDTPAPGNSTDTHTVSVPTSGRPVEARVDADIAGCTPPPSRQITLVACNVDPCPPAITVEVRERQSGRPMFTVSSDRTDDDDSPCLPPGEYELSIVAPTGDAFEYKWFGPDGLLAEGATTTYTLTEDHAADATLVAAVELERTRDPCEIPVPVPMRVCTCPGPIAIKVFRGEEEVDTTKCVPPGFYTAVAVADGLDESDLEWTIRGRKSVVDGTLGSSPAGGVPFTIPTKVTYCDPNKPLEYPLSVKARHKTAGHCPERSASLQLQPCEDFVFCVDCILLRLFVVLCACVVALGLVFVLCPGITDLWWLRNAAASGGESGSTAASIYAAIKAAYEVVRVVVIVAACLALIAGVIALFAWINRCKPKPCRDWLLLVWQLLMGCGFLIFYYGSCESCTIYLGLPGLALFVVGVVVAGVWGRVCNVRFCHWLLELQAVGSVTAIVSTLSIVLAPCKWDLSAVALVVWDTFFLVLPFIVIDCFVRDRAYSPAEGSD